MIDIETYKIFRTLPKETQELIRSINIIIPPWVIKIKDKKFQLRIVKKFAVKFGTQY